MSRKAMACIALGVGMEVADSAAVDTSCNGDVLHDDAD